MVSQSATPSRPSRFGCADRTTLQRRKRKPEVGRLTACRAAIHCVKPMSCVMICTRGSKLLNLDKPGCTPSVMVLITDGNLPE